MKTRKNLHNKTSNITIGKIWAKWCPHCIHMIPAWDKMKLLIRKNTKTLPAFMDVEEAELHKIDDYNKNNPNGTFIDSARGYPTIYKIYGGNVEYYSGERKAEKMAAWALNQKNISGGAIKLKLKKTRLKSRHITY